MTEHEKMLTPTEAGQRLGVTDRTVKRWIEDGKLRGFRPGKAYQVPESAVEGLLRESEIRPKALPAASTAELAATRYLRLDEEDLTELFADASREDALNIYRALYEEWKHIAPILVDDQDALLNAPTRGFDRDRFFDLNAFYWELAGREHRALQLAPGPEETEAVFRERMNHGLLRSLPHRDYVPGRGWEERAGRDRGLAES